MICISKVSLIDSRLGTCCQKSLNTVQKGDLLIWYKYEACKRFSALQYNVESHQVYGSREGRTWVIMLLKVHHRFSFDKSCNWGNLDFLEVARVQNCGYHQVRRVQYVLLSYINDLGDCGVFLPEQFCINCCCCCCCCCCRVPDAAGVMVPPPPLWKLLLAMEAADFCMCLLMSASSLSMVSSSLQSVLAEGRSEGRRDQHPVITL